MTDTHPLRTHVVGGTIAGLLVAVILWAFGFIGVLWRGFWSAVSWGWHQLTASIAVPLWLLLAVAGYAVALTVFVRRRSTTPSEPTTEQPSSLREGEPLARPRKLDRLQEQAMRAMAEADGGTPTIEELADDLDVNQLRLEQVLEDLETIGYVRVIRHVTHGPVVDVTRAGRDYLIAKGLV
jgi:hypothetical protein